MPPTIWSGCDAAAAEFPASVESRTRSATDFRQELVRISYIPSRLTASLQPTAATPRAIAIDTCVGFAGCVLNNGAAAGI
jgi:hypothetical protein